jgi:hypothetical protein
MTNQHLITPPPELLQQWCAHSNEHETYDQFWCHIATQAARWGADQELQACCDWLASKAMSERKYPELRATRRPKPPNLKEQALNLLNNHNNGWTPSPKQWQTIRIAVEALPNDC